MVSNLATPLVHWESEQLALLALDQQGLQMDQADHHKTKSLPTSFNRSCPRKHLLAAHHLLHQPLLQLLVGGPAVMTRGERL